MISIQAPQGFIQAGTGHIRHTWWRVVAAGRRHVGIGSRGALAAGLGLSLLLGLGIEAGVGLTALLGIRRVGRRGREVHGRIPARGGTLLVLLHVLLRVPGRLLLLQLLLLLWVLLGRRLLRLWLLLLAGARHVQAGLVGVLHGHVAVAVVVVGAAGNGAGIGVLAGGGSIRVVLHLRRHGRVP